MASHYYQQQDQQSQHIIPHTGAEPSTRAPFPQSLADMYVSSVNSAQYLENASANPYGNTYAAPAYYGVGGISEMDRARNIALAVQLGLGTDGHYEVQNNPLMQQNQSFDHTSRSRSLGQINNIGMSGCTQSLDNQVVGLSAATNQFATSLPGNNFAQSTSTSHKAAARPGYRPLPDSNQSTPEPGQIYNDAQFPVPQAGNTLQLMSADSNQAHVLQDYQRRQVMSRTGVEQHVTEPQGAGWSTGRSTSVPVTHPVQAPSVQAIARNGREQAEAHEKAMLEKMGEHSQADPQSVYQFWNNPSQGAQRQNSNFGINQQPRPVSNPTSRNGPLRSSEQALMQKAIPSDNNHGYLPNTSRPLSAENSSINQLGSASRQPSNHDFAAPGEMPRRNMLGYYSYVERRNLESMPSHARSQQSASTQVYPSNPSTAATASIPSKTSPPSAEKASIWPASKRRPLAMLAKQYLESLPENTGKVISSDEVMTLLNTTVTLNDLIRALEDKGFKVGKTELAKALVNGIYKKPQNATVSATSPRLEVSANVQSRNYVNGLGGQTSSHQLPPDWVIPTTGAPLSHNTMPTAHSAKSVLQNFGNQHYSNHFPRAVRDERNRDPAASLRYAINQMSGSSNLRNESAYPRAGTYQNSNSFDVTGQMSDQNLLNEQRVGTTRAGLSPYNSPYNVWPPESTVGAHLETATFKQSGSDIPTQSTGQSIPQGSLSHFGPNSHLITLAGRGNSNHIVDLVGSDDDTVSSDDNETHPRKRARLDPDPRPAQGTGHLEKSTQKADAIRTTVLSAGTVGPSTVDTSKAPSKPKPTSNMLDITDPAIKLQLKILRSKHLVQNINEKAAVKKTQFNVNTLARDILITKGTHPTDMALNWHLEPLRKNFVNVGHSADLSTFRWDVVDPVPITPQAYTSRVNDEANKALKNKFLNSQTKGREAGLITDGKRSGPPGGPNRRFIPTNSTAARDPKSLTKPVTPEQSHEPAVQQPTSHQSSLPKGIDRTSNTINLLHEGKMGLRKGLFTPMKNNLFKPADTKEAPPAKPAITVINPVSTPVKGIAVQIPSNAPSPHTPTKTPATASKLLSVSIPRSAPSTPTSAAKVFAAVSIPRSTEPADALQRRLGGRPTDIKKIELTATDLNPTKQTTGLDRARRGDRPPLQPSAPIWRRPKKPKPLRYLTAVPPDGVGVIIPSRSPTLAQELSYVEKDPEPVGKKAKKPSMRAVAPKFQVFPCQWQGCSAKLHNLETLRKHVFRIHNRLVKQNHVEDAVVERKRLACLWNECALDENAPSSHVYYTSEEAWKEHIEKKHLTRIAWELGDGPSTHPLELEPSKYLSDSRGRQITPLARTRGPPDPLPPGSGSSPTRAYHKAHGNVTEHQKMQAELNSRIATKVMLAVVVSPPDPEVEDDTVEYEESEDGSVIRVLV